MSGADAYTKAQVPWGLTRMTTRLPISPPSYREVVLDPVTQTARYFDGQGLEIDMGRHGTNKETSTASKSGGSPGTDGRDPKPQVIDDSTVDYVPD